MIFQLYEPILADDIISPKLPFRNNAHIKNNVNTIIIMI